MSDERDDSLPRREFLQRSAAAALGVGLGLVGTRSRGAQTPPVRPRVERYVRLGRTGLEISDISFGAGVSDDPALVLDAFDRGINYFDTAESYPVGGNEGRSEEAIGKALEGKRGEVFLATKTAAMANDSAMTLMLRLHESLRRLETDHVDVYFNHAVNDLARAQNDEWLKFVERAKEQGKIRFSGVSGHGGNLISCLDHVLDEDQADVILVAHNFGQDPAFYERFTRSFDIVATQIGLPRVLEKAKAKDVGVLAMKVLMGARLNDMRPYERGGATFAQAALRWTLANLHVDGVVISMKDKPLIDEYLQASGSGPAPRTDLQLLERYAQLNGSGYCRHGCNVCESSCDRGAPIAELMRVRMYATDYQDLAQARGAYRALGSAAETCATCTNPTCANACPIGIDVPGRMGSLATLLDLPTRGKA